MEIFMLFHTNGTPRTDVMGGSKWIDLTGVERRSTIS